MKLYITNLSLLMLLIFYLPAVLWVLWRISRSPRWHGTGKAGLSLLTLILAYVIPLGDVTVNSMAMAKVCPSAGLHVYKTVKVQGFVGHYDLRGSPYQFIEFPALRANGTHYWRRFEKQPDGSIAVKELSQPTAEYEVISVDWHMDDKHGVESSGYVGRNRLSGGILAEWNLFNSLPGWLDRILVIRWFGTGGRDGCHGKPAYGFESKILTPRQLIN